MIVLQKKLLKLALPVAMTIPDLPAWATPPSRGSNDCFTKKAFKLALPVAVTIRVVRPDRPAWAVRAVQKDLPTWETPP